MSHFDPNSWLVWESFTEEAFRFAVGTNTQNIDTLSGTIRRTQLLQLPDETRRRNARLLRVREHEWTHYRQHASTQFGLLVHRLTAIQEAFYLGFLRELAKQEKLTSRDLTLARYRGGRTEHLTESAQVLLNICELSTVLLGLLWKKTTSISNLIYICEAMRIAYQVTRLLPGASTMEWTSKLDPEESTCGSEYLTVESVVEGFARFRELNDLYVHFKEKAPEIWRSEKHPVAEYAISYLSHYAGIPDTNLFIGALLDAVVAVIPEPELTRGACLWEEVHPGRILGQALERLDPATLRNSNPEQLYNLALTLVDSSQGDVSKEYTRGGLMLAEAARRCSEVVHRSDMLEARYQRIIYSTLSQCFFLRGNHPWIFAFPQWALHTRPNAWNEFVDRTSPLILVQPDWIKVNGSITDEKDQIALLACTWTSLVESDLMENGTLVRAIRLFEQMRRTFGDGLLEVLRALLRRTLPDKIWNLLQQDPRVQHSIGGIK